MMLATRQTAQLEEVIWLSTIAFSIYSQLTYISADQFPYLKPDGIHVHGDRNPSMETPV